MRNTFKIITILTLCFSLCMCFSCHRSKAGRNPYKEAKVKPSERQMRADKKVIAKGNRAYKKQMLHNRKHLFGSKRDPGAPKGRK